jgi:hypothetical protein
MAKFTLTFKDPDNDHYEIIEKIARQNKLDPDEVQALVSRFTDGEYVTIQFDTDKNKCWVLFTNKEGVNDFKPERDVVIKTTDYWEKYTTGRKVHVASLQAQIDEAVTAYQAEEDKKSPAARNLLRFIEDVRQELNGFKGANWNEENGGETNSPFIA